METSVKLWSTGRPLYYGEGPNSTTGEVLVVMVENDSRF